MSASAQSPLARLAVVGAGAWGSVLATLLAENGHDVRLWMRDAEKAAAWRSERRDPDRRTPVELPALVVPTHDLGYALDDADGVFFAVPNAALREVLRAARAASESPALAISCSKGLFAPDLSRPSGLISSMLETDVAVLSGPNLAADIARGRPAAATLAHPRERSAATAQAWLTSRRYRVYREEDVVGVELAGALKNIVALAAGMSDGLSLGENAKAALVTRGLAEMIRLGEHLGGQPQTFYGLAGVGDLFATAAAKTSRNHGVGERLASGETIDAILASGTTAEGIATSLAVDAFAEGHELRLPITRQVAAVIRGERTATAALDMLLAGDPRTEWAPARGYH